MRVLVGVDGSSPSRTAIELVAGIAWPPETVVHLVVALDRPAASVGRRHTPRTDAQAHALIDEVVPALRGRYAIARLVSRGGAADVLLSAASDLPADLVVVGSRGLGVAASALLGSVSATLVDQSPCPVLVARRPAVSTILLATDGSRSSEHIPAVLAAWNVFTDVPVEVLSVAPPPVDSAFQGSAAWVLQGERRILNASHDVDRHRVIADDMAARLARTGWQARGRVRHGNAAHEIEGAAIEWQADLIVMGSRGLGGWRRVLGSVAHHVLLHSRSSVLVMRGHVPAWPHQDALSVGVALAGA